MNKFSRLMLAPELLQAVEALGYKEMTEIQADALPPMLHAHDVLAQAKTGSGKTAAFSLAVLAQLQSEQAHLQSLVLCPTRELADQVSKEIRALARFIPNVKVLSLCGGVPVRLQLPSLAHQPHIVVGTPGRIQDLIDRQALLLDDLRSVVVDEADRMLDMGFLDAIGRILEKAPATRTTWMFSATYPEEVREISRRFQNNPVAVTVADRHDESVIRQQFYQVDSTAKPDAVLALLLTHRPESCLIFCNTKIDTGKLADALWKTGVPAIALHGDLEQREREEALLQFANGSCRVLVATDVAARGLDIKALPMVIAYELSNDADVHVHRAGRTGRAGESGAVFSLVSGREMGRVAAIERVLGRPIEWTRLPQVRGLPPLPAPAMKTLLIEAGRQDKLRPGDILGALTGEAGLQAVQAGRIDVFPTRSYVALERDCLDAVVKKLRTGKIKGRKIRVRKL
ncbi:MAG: ATP-dependent RNA helicase DbpA [Pseudomonadales bacterium]|nr:ATP-dependent RNA helicase DbpA [Pseudomonadales bacterium]